MPFYELKRSLIKPVSQPYPKHLQTLGDHLRWNRLKRGLHQHDVARQIGCSPDSVTLWELNHVQPALKFIPPIIDFLGYGPLTPGQSLGERLANIRRQHGLTLTQLARYLNVDPGALAKWESGAPITCRHILYRLESFVEECEKDAGTAANLDRIRQAGPEAVGSYRPAASQSDPSTISGHLLQRRLGRGLSQQAAGKLIGVSRMAISEWEAGKAEPDHRTLPAVLGFLGILPIPTPRSVRLRLFRRALGLSTTAFERQFQINRDRLRLWETGQQEIEGGVMEQITTLIEQRFPADQFARHPLATGASLPPVRKENH